MFSTIWRTGAYFQAFFNLPTWKTVSQEPSMIIFWFLTILKVWNKPTKNSKYQPQNISRSHDIVILLKSKKGLELVSVFRIEHKTS